jgi:hypothetical protein
MKFFSFFTPERRWVLIFAILVVIMTTVPYIVGFAIQDDEWRFTGFVFGVEDGNSYLAKMLSGSYGEWLFRSSYSGVSQNGVIANLLYIISGKLVTPPGSHVKLVFIYHLLRFFTAFLAIFASYDFISFFIKAVKLRRFGLLIIILGGGLGWLLLLLGKYQIFGTIPLEFYSPETFGFLSLIGLPHLSLARATFLWGLLTYLNFYQLDNHIRFAGSIKLGVLWLLTALAQPITAIVMGALIGFHIFVLFLMLLLQKFRQVINTWQQWINGIKLTFFASLIPLPFIIYNILLFTTDEYLIAWTNQNIISSPHPIHYLLAFGLCLPFVVVGSLRIIHDKPWTGLLLIVWVLALPIFAYYPVNVQRRLLEGIWVAIIVLSLYVFDIQKESEPYSYHPFVNFWQRPFMRYFLYLSLPSTILIFFGGILSTVRQEPPIFRPAGEVASFAFLEITAREGEIVLSSYNTGNALPAWTPLHVVVGHGPESIGLEKLMEGVSAFYSDTTSDLFREHFLEDLNIRYVFWGPAERDLGNWDPRAADYLENIYTQNGYSVFEVFPTSLSNE